MIRKYSRDFIALLLWQNSLFELRPYRSIFFGRKESSSKIGLVDILSIANYDLNAIKSEKPRIKCQENAKNGFSGIIVVLSVGKISFLKIGHCQLLGISIFNQCEKFHEKIRSTAREIQEIPFLGENRLFRRFLDNSGVKNQFY